MDELVKLVSEKTGLSEEMSRAAVKIVVDYLKEKLPGPLAAQIDSVLAGGAAAGSVEGLAKGLGGLL
jgi:hypothetical protein